MFRAKSCIQLIWVKCAAKIEFEDQKRITSFTQVRLVFPKWLPGFSVSFIHKEK